jgi:formylglycine-generating enzyme required for sulfatase activity
MGNEDAMRRNRAWVVLAGWAALGCGGDGPARQDAGVDAATTPDAGRDASSMTADARVDAASDASSSVVDASALKAELTRDPNWAWVAMPAGTFAMGGGNLTHPDAVPVEVFQPDGPIHTVQVPAFELARAEVTVAQYRLCVQAGSCTVPNMKDYTCSPSAGTAENNWLASDRSDHPVNCVTPAQGAEFCSWAGARLPSEAEWEYAARSGGQDKLYTWGEAAPTCNLAAIRFPHSTCDGKPYSCECGDRSLPVCSKRVGDTDQGVCDMTGNVSEPVADAYHETYEGAPTDGSAWGAFDDNGIARGASYVSYAPYLLRVTSRAQHHAYASVLMGIRCAR